MSSTAKKYLSSLLRWTVAAIGAWYVLSQLSWNDRALVILDSTNVPQWATVIQGDEDSSTLTIRTDNGGRQTIDANSVVSAPDKKNMTVTVGGQTLPLLGVDLADRYHARRVLVRQWGGGSWIRAEQTSYQVMIPHPRVQVGVRHLVASARRGYLFWSLAVFPINYLITTFRWHELLKAVGVVLSPGRTFVLNMVGVFYNTFMPGSTGGDVLKMYYVAKQTHHRTRAVVTVIVDRLIGLLALIILGGTMATFAFVHWHIRQTAGVAAGSLLIVTGTAAFLLVFYVPYLHRISGLEWFLARLPMQDKVRKAVEAMHLYGKRPRLALAALLVSFPVHIIIIVSATFAGVAFGLHIPWYYYWTVVPVSVLAGSIPISPQGAGVMEYFAIWLLEPIGCTVAEAVALTMSIRLVQIIWNLAGGVFVLRGGYHAPTADQQRQVEAQDDDEPLASKAFSGHNGINHE
jgi:uncharacterized protein (TIRG00374 family)